MLNKLLCQKMKKLNGNFKEVIMKNKIKQILENTPKGNNYQCPHCEEFQDYIPNPFYYHQCKHCGTKLQLEELIYVSDEEKLAEQLHNLFQEELKEEINFATSQSFQPNYNHNDAIKLQNTLRKTQ